MEAVDREKHKGRGGSSWEQAFWQQSEAGTFHFEILTCVLPLHHALGQLIPTQWARYQQHQAAPGI